MNEHCKGLQLLSTVVLLPDEEGKLHEVFINRNTTVTNALMTSLLFTLPADRKYVLTLSLLGFSDDKTVSNNYSISTFDVQNASIPVIQSNYTKTNKICTTLHFASQSRASGLVEFRLKGSKHFYQAILEQDYTRRMASGCVTVSPDKGVYAGFVYDLENGNRSKYPAYIFVDLVHVPAVGTPPTTMMRM